MDKQLNVIFTVKIAAMAATAKAPLGPTLGQYGIPIAEFCTTFNKLTVAYKEGVVINCKVLLYTDQSYELHLLEPDLSYFLKTSINFSIGWGAPNHFEASRKSLGLITPLIVYEICLLKYEHFNNKKQVTFKAYYKMCLGTLYSMGYIYLPTSSFV